MNPNNQDMLENLRKMNEMSIQNMLDDYRKKRNNRKMKENLKTSQTDMKKAMKDYLNQQLPTANNNSTTSSLNETLGKLFQ